MPRVRCQRNGKNGWKWGGSGFCYTFTEGDKGSEQRAKDKADRQGRAIESSKSRNR